MYCDIDQSRHMSGFARVGTCDARLRGLQNACVNETPSSALATNRDC